MEQVIIFFRASPAGRLFPLWMLSEMAPFVVWRRVSWGRATNGGYPFGASMTQFTDMVKSPGKTTNAMLG